MTDVIDALAECAPPTQRDIDWLLSHGVPPLALARTWCGLPAAIRRARIVIVAERRFEFADMVPSEPSQGALVIPVHDRFGYLDDITAWNRHFLGLWLGRAAVLGGEHVSAFRLGEGVAVYRDPLAWLRAERRGVVVVDPSRAAEALDGVSLIAEDLDHARALRRMLTLPAPTILLPAGARAAA